MQRSETTAQIQKIQDGLVRTLCESIQEAGKIWAPIGDVNEGRHVGDFKSLLDNILDVLQAEAETIANNCVQELRCKEVLMLLRDLVRQKAPFVKRCSERSRWWNLVYGSYIAEELTELLHDVEAYLSQLFPDESISPSSMEIIVEIREMEPLGTTSTQKRLCDELIAWEPELSWNTDPLEFFKRLATYLGCQSLLEDPHKLRVESQKVKVELSLTEGWHWRSGTRDDELLSRVDALLSQVLTDIEHITLRAEAPASDVQAPQVEPAPAENAVDGMKYWCRDLLGPIDQPMAAFTCPIKKEVMRDPVMVTSGLTYDREEIVKWITSCQKKGQEPHCPMTKQQIDPNDLRFNRQSYDIILEWCVKNEQKQISRAVTVLQDPKLEKEQQEQVVATLLGLCRSRPVNRGQVGRESGLLGTLADLLKTAGPGGMAVRIRVMELIDELAKLDDNLERIGAPAIKLVERVVGCGVRESDAEAGLAVAIVCKLVQDPHLCESRVGGVRGIGNVRGVFVLLRKCVNSKEPEQIASALKAQQILESYESNVICMVQVEGMVTPLLNHFTSDESPWDMKVRLADALHTVNLDREARTKIAMCGLPTLIRLLVHGDRDAQLAALSVLRMLVTTDQQKHSTALGKDPTQLLQTNEALLSELLTALVHLLFLSGDAQLEGLSAAVLGALAVGGSYEGDTSREALATLERLLMDDQQMRERQDAVPNLMNRVSSADGDMGASVLQVFWGLLQSSAADHMASMLQAASAVSTLVGLLSQEHEQLRFWAIKLLHQLAKLQGDDVTSELEQDRRLKIVVEAAKRLTKSEEKGLLLSTLALLQWRVVVDTLKESDIMGAMAPLAVVRGQENRRHDSMLEELQEAFFHLLARFASSVGDPVVLQMLRQLDAATICIDGLFDLMSDLAKLHAVQALTTLIRLTRSLTVVPPEEPPPTGCMSILRRRSRRSLSNVPSCCAVHGGICSVQSTFCILEGDGIKALIRILNMEGRELNEVLVGASLDALGVLLEPFPEQSHSQRVVRDLLLELDIIRVTLQLFAAQPSDQLVQKLLVILSQLVLEGAPPQLSNSPAIFEIMRHAQRASFLTDQLTRRLGLQILQALQAIPPDTTTVMKSTRNVSTTQRSLAQLRTSSGTQPRSQATT